MPSSVKIIRYACVEAMKMLDEVAVLRGSAEAAFAAASLTRIVSACA